MADETQKIKVYPSIQEPTKEWKRLTNKDLTLFPDILGFANTNQDLQVLEYNSNLE